MKNAIRTSLNVALGLCLGVTLAACSSTSGGSTASSGGSSASSAAPAGDRYSFTGSPTVNASKLPASAKTGTAPASPIRKWQSASTEAGSFVFEPSAQNGAGAFVLTGDGASPAREIFSPVISVSPGRTYTFSAFVDASKVTDGWTYLWVSNESRNRILMKAQIAPKQAGRFAFKMRIPSDVHKITYGYYTAGCRLGSGQKIVFAQPAVTPDVR